MKEVLDKEKSILSQADERRPEFLVNKTKTIAREAREVEVIDDKIYEAINFFDSNRNSQVVHDKWLSKYFDKPTVFFDDQNLEELKKINQGERLILLAKASYYLINTPQMIEKYYTLFPEDLIAVIEKFKMLRGYANTSLEYNLFSISAGEMLKVEPEILKQYQSIGQYLEIVDRRELAPQLLLTNFEYKFNESFKEFGDGATGFLKAIEEAGNLVMHGDHFINTNQIFTPEYQAMTEKNKAKFLRKAIAELHFSLLFHEVYNSCFTKESVEKDRQRYLRSSIEKDPLYFILSKGRHNVAHSMVYKTFQPVSVYDMNQDRFEYEMNSTAETGGDLEEYPFHRLIVAILAEFKKIKEEKSENTELLVDFWNKNRNPIFGNGVADALSAQDTNLGASKMLELIRKEEKDKGPLAAILYRLEFGRIGISEEGVRYLEHLYDLGEYNNPNFHVSRLTADGDIGIFNQDLQLIKFFQLGDLSTPEKKTRAVVYDFVYETLFIGKKNETKEERDKRMQYLEEFKQNYYTKRAQLEKESGVTLNNLSFKEQGWFIIYFSKASSLEKEQIYNFIKNFGEEGIKTFLSLEGGEQNGQIILELGKILEHNTAKAIFTKFVEVARYINLTGAEISRQYLKNNKTVEPAAEIIRRAGQILVSKHKKMQDDNYIEQTPENKRKINEEIINDLENIKVDTVVFSAMFKTIFETYGGAEFQEVVGLDLEHKNKKEFTFEDQEELKEFIAKVYAQKPAVRDYVIKKVHEDFLSSETGHWYLLRRHGKLIATMRFNKLGEEIARATSFMVDPQLQTSAIGKAMEKNILDVESANKKILAVAEVLGQPISHYIEKNNWLITSFYIDKDSGIPFFEIMRDDYNIAKYSSRNFSNEEILQISEDPDKANELNCLVLKISSIPNEFDQERIKTALEQGFVTTRFLRGENFGSNAYLVFEKNKTPVQLEEKKLANFSAK